MTESEFEEFNHLHNKIEFLMDGDRHSFLKNFMYRAPREWHEYTIEMIENIYNRMLRLAKYEVAHA